MPKISLRNSLSTAMTADQVTFPDIIRKLEDHQLADVLDLEFDDEKLVVPRTDITGIHYFVVRAVGSAPFQNDPRFRSSFYDLITNASGDEDKAQILILFTGNCTTPVIKCIYQNLIQLSKGHSDELTDDVIWPIALLEFIETFKGIGDRSDWELTELTSGLINLILAKPATVPFIDDTNRINYVPKFCIGHGKLNQFDFTQSAHPYYGLNVIEKEHLDQLVEAKLLYVPDNQQDAHKTQGPLPLQYGLNQSTFYGIIQSFMSTSGIGSVPHFREITNQVNHDRENLLEASEGDSEGIKPFNYYLDDKVRNGSLVALLMQLKPLSYDHKLEIVRDVVDRLTQADSQEIKRTGIMAVPNVQEIIISDLVEKIISTDGKSSSIGHTHAQVLADMLKDQELDQKIDILVKTLKVINLEQCEVLLEAFDKDPLSLVVSDQWQLIFILKRLNHDKCKAVCESMKDHLHSIVYNYDDLYSILKSCPADEQRTFVCETLIDQFPRIFCDKSLKEFFHILEFLDHTTGGIVCNALGENLQSMIETSFYDDVMHGECIHSILEKLSPEKRRVVYEVFKDKISIKDKNDITILLVLAYEISEDTCDHFSAFIEGSNSRALLDALTIWSCYVGRTPFDFVKHNFSIVFSIFKKMESEDFYKLLCNEPYGYTRAFFIDIITRLKDHIKDLGDDHQGINKLLEVAVSRRNKFSFSRHLLFICNDFDRQLQSLIFELTDLRETQENERMILNYR